MTTSRRAACAPGCSTSTRGSKRPRKTCRSTFRPRGCGPSLWTMCCCMALPAWERPPWRASSPTRWGSTSASPPAPPLKRRGIWRLCSPTSTKTTCCSSTRSTASTAAWRRCCIPPWRITHWTSSSGKGLPPVPSAWTCPGSPSSAPPPGRDSCPRPCGTGSASSCGWSCTLPRSCRPSSPARRVFWAWTSIPAARWRSPGGPGALPASPTAS